MYTRHTEEGGGADRERRGGGGRGIRRREEQVDQVAEVLALLETRLQHQEPLIQVEEVEEVGCVLMARMVLVALADQE